MQILSDQWRLSKPVARSKRGVVVSQHVTASQAGLDVLSAGGNAVDAAIATALALGIVEPWMSGLGGCGYMMVYRAKTQQTQLVDFGTVAPRALDPAAFPLTSQGSDDDLFGWPSVDGDRNVHGPFSIGVPGTVAGFGLAHERFGHLPWRELFGPAIASAKLGHPVSWWSSLKIAAEAAVLRGYEGAGSVYLPNGLPPMPGEQAMARLALDPLADTLAQLAEAGAQDFYTGDLATSLVADTQAAGGWLSGNDLAAYQALICEPQVVSRNGAELHLPQGLNAGPTFARALSLLPEIAAGLPGAEAYAAYGKALYQAYQHRLQSHGHDGDLAGQGCTTHLCVADGEGNLVALTNTLLSSFGSKVLLPNSGVMMNNGIMWFDPRPGRANSLAAGQRPLCNMVPMIATRDSRPWFAIGASGGRRILPAVFQLSGFMVDGGLRLEDAAHLPRLNVDGGPAIQASERLGPEMIAAIAEILSQEVALETVPATVQPNLFANALAVAVTDAGLEGMAQLPSPVAAALGL